MEKTLLDVIKLIIESSKKHIIPVAISFIAMIITFASFDPKHTLLLKLGKTLFMLFFFCIYFVLIEFAIWIVNYFRKFVSNKKAKQKADKEKKEQKEREMQEAEISQEKMVREKLEDLWKFVDSLSKTEYGYLEKFLQTDNEVIEAEETFGLRNRLFNSNMVHKTVLREPIEKHIKLQREYTEDRLFMPIDSTEIEPAIMGYKLKEYWFKLLLLSKEKHGKISNFYKCK